MGVSPSVTIGVGIDFGSSDFGFGTWIPSNLREAIIEHNDVEAVVAMCLDNGDVPSIDDQIGWSERRAIFDEFGVTFRVYGTDGYMGDVLMVTDTMSTSYDYEPMGLDPKPTEDTEGCRSAASVLSGRPSTSNATSCCSTRTGRRSATPGSRGSTTWSTSKLRRRSSRRSTR